MGAADFGQEADYAGIFETPGASLVSQSEWLVEATAGLNKEVSC